MGWLHLVPLAPGTNFRMMIPVRAGSRPGSQLRKTSIARADNWLLARTSVVQAGGRARMMIYGDGAEADQVV